MKKLCVQNGFLLPKNFKANFIILSYLADSIYL